MSEGVAYLTVAEDVIARLDEIRPEMPWFACRFTPNARFSEFASLFARELSLVESEKPFDAARWEETWEEIWSRGVALVLPNGERAERDFAVHVYNDGTARFRH